MKTMLSWIVGAFLVVSAQLALAADYQPGVHYKVLDKPVRTADPAKVEVVEMFGYWCPHCDRFETHLQPWKKKLGDGVLFQPVPVVFRPNQIEVAKAYFIAESLGVLDQTHSGMFNMIHRQNKMPAKREQLFEFFEDYGVSKADFDKVYDSFALNSSMSLANKKARDYRLTGVPTLIVNGKYVVTGNSAGGHEGMINVVNHLIEKEKASQ